MADGLGSRALIKSALWQEMKDAGVRTSVALPFHQIFKTIILSRLDLRNHRKIKTNQLSQPTDILQPVMR